MADSSNVKVQGLTSVGGQKFDIKRVLMQLLPTLMSLVTELLVTGKLAKGTGRDFDAIKALLRAVLVELDNIDPTPGD